MGIIKKNVLLICCRNWKAEYSVKYTFCCHVWQAYFSNTHVPRTHLCSQQVHLQMNYDIKMKQEREVKKKKIDKNWSKKATNNINGDRTRPNVSYRVWDMQPSPLRHTLGNIIRS